ncbi:MAG: hypothetical protein NDF53_04925 [archaeon GB-1867-097]|nr:hypothetical protein [Candidatus Culexmicrobium thermophilum]MCS7385056.1 hypothetical protein [Candidatus Culexmicrobium thermophilum]HDO20256.1 hypothetical protein [Candidatus Bathyarchaeota archaeon]
MKEKSNILDNIRENSFKPENPVFFGIEIGEKNVIPRCPYTRNPDVEHSGLFVKCVILNQNVSPVIFPCFRDFENCKCYKPAAEKL